MPKWVEHKAWVKTKMTQVCNPALGQARPGAIIRSCSISLSLRNRIIFLGGHVAPHSDFGTLATVVQHPVVWTQLVEGGREGVCTEDAQRTAVLYLGCPREGLNWQEPEGAGTSCKSDTKLCSGLETSSILPGSASAISHGWIPAVGWSRGSFQRLCYNLST